MADEILFTTQDLTQAVHSYPQAIANEVKQWTKDKTLGTPLEDLVEFLVEKYKLDVPRLRLDEKHVAHHGESTVPARDPFDDYGRGRPIPVETVTIAIPFDGDRDLFTWAPSTRNFNNPRATVGANSIGFTIFDRKLSPDGVKQSMDKTIADLELHLGWLRKDADGWNAQLPSLARQSVEHRKQELMQRDSVVAALGISLGPRADPAGFQSVSLQRKPRPVTVAPAAPKTAFTPEPALSTVQYDDVMKAINRLAMVIERSPATFAKMGETEIRDIVLVNLNADFDRHATGETFNAAGKTDILVNEKGKNAFIGECKIWGGQKDLLAAIDQVQSYSTWRDSKAALLIFSRNADFSAVLATIREAVPTHPKFKRQHSVISETETRYVFKHRDDDSKEMLLAVTVFHIPDGNDRPMKG